MENLIKQNIDDIVVFEGMTSISSLIHSLELSSNDRSIIKILFDKDKVSSKRREFSFLKSMSIKYKFELTTVSGDELNDLASGNTHGGIIAICTQRTFLKLSSKLINKNGIYYMFEGIEDPYNFGYAIRSVYASGADGIIMNPRNWLSATSIVTKSSAGTSELLEMYISDASEAIDTFKSLGFTIVCAGIRDSESIYEAELKKPLLVIIGGEKRGISRAVLDKADKVVRIDYGREFRGSLPSVAATSIISFEILRKNS